MLRSSNKLECGGVLAAVSKMVGLGTIVIGGVRGVVRCI
jgi:hypothetical protein